MTNKNNIVKIIIVTVILIVVVSVLQMATSSENIEKLLERYQSIGPVIIVAYIVLSHVLAPIVGSPGIFISIGLFGVSNTIIYLYIASIVSATINFFISRVFGRKLVERFVGKTAIKTVDLTTAAFGIKLLVVSRVFGSALFELISYAAGLTNLRFSTYIIITIFFNAIPTLGYYYIFQNNLSNNWLNGVLFMLSLITSGAIFAYFFKKYLLLKKTQTVHRKRPSRMLGGVFLKHNLNRNSTSRNYRTHTFPQIWILAALFLFLGVIIRPDISSDADIYMLRIYNSNVYPVSNLLTIVGVVLLSVGSNMFKRQLDEAQTETREIGDRLILIGGILLVVALMIGISLSFNFRGKEISHIQDLPVTQMMLTYFVLIASSLVRVATSLLGIGIGFFSWSLRTLDLGANKFFWSTGFCMETLGAMLILILGIEGVHFKIINSFGIILIIIISIKYIKNDFYRKD